MESLSRPRDGLVPRDAAHYGDLAADGPFALLQLAPLDVLRGASRAFTGAEAHFWRCLEKAEAHTTRMSLTGAESQRRPNSKL